MKSKKITTTVTLIWLVAFVSGAALADNENAPPAGKSPLMPNYFPAKGMIISDTGYSQIETKTKSNASIFSFTTTLNNVEQKIRYGITDQTEVFLTQAYAIGGDEYLSVSGKNYFEIGFHNPVLGAEHRLDFSDKQNIYAVGLKIKPEVSYSGYRQSQKQQQIYGKYSWQVGDNIWLSARLEYTNTQEITSASNIEDFSVQFSVSKRWEENSASFGIGLNKTFDYTGRVLYRNPIALTSVANEISPTATASFSHSFGNSFYGIFDYAWKSSRYSTTFLGQYENLGSRTNTTTLQTVTARIVKEF